MNILLAEHAGFCFGVRRAADRIEALLAEAPTPRILTLGELIHNRTYLDALAARGVEEADEETATAAALASDTRGRTVLVLRTHGVSAEVEARMRALAEAHPHFEIADMTCPFVKKVHRIAEGETDADTLFLLFGKPGHPEVCGAISRARGAAAVFSSPEELTSLLRREEPSEKAICLAAQTTENSVEWKKSKKILKNYCTNSKIFDTICDVTKKRQDEAIALASRAEVTLVIGGRGSSNTKELYRLCREVCPRTYFVESVADLPPSLSTASTVAITAGASTPDGLIMEVYKKMDEIRTEDFAEMLEGTLKELHTGETVTGYVTRIEKDVIYVDVGVKATGMVTRDQITDDQNVKLTDLFKVGEELRLFVIRVNDGEGIVTLSKKRVDRDKSWYDIVDMKENGGIVEGPVVEANKGGVVIEALGNRIFVPASRTGLAKDADFTTLVGTTQRARIIDIDEQRHRAVASIGSVLVEERKAREQAIWETLEVGKHYLGTVKTLTSYGAFVDIGGVDGMVHNTELSWKRIRNPKEVVEIGQQIDVYIKDIDLEKRRISLGYKSDENDPWRAFTAQYQVGDVITGKIVSMMPFGAFVEVIDGVDGLIHISHICQEKIARPQDALQMGQEVTAKIIAIDDEHRRLSLSIRTLLDEAQRAEERAAREAEMAERSEAAAAAAKERAELEAEMAPYIVRRID